MNILITYFLNILLLIKNLFLFKILISDIVNLNYVSLFLFLCLSYLFVGVATQEILGLEQMIIETLFEQLTTEQVNNYLTFNRKYEWLGYLMLPVIMLLKIALIAKILDAGAFFMEKEVSYAKLFTVVLKAEFIFLAIPFLKLGWFYFVKTDYDLSDIQMFYPLSLLNITGYQNLEPWFIYPLQVINLFELIYWFLLAMQLKRLLQLDWSKSFSIVGYSYGIMLFIWIVVVMFFYLNTY